jgi:hypothetical protein
MQVVVEADVLCRMAQVVRLAQVVVAPEAAPTAVTQQAPLTPVAVVVAVVVALHLLNTQEPTEDLVWSLWPMLTPMTILQALMLA